MYIFPEPMYPRRMSERIFSTLYVLGTICLLVSFIVTCVDFATRIRSTFADGFTGDLSFSEGMRLLTSVPTCESQVKMSVGGVSLDTALNLSSAQFASVILSVGTLGVVIAHGLLLLIDIIAKHMHKENVRRMRFRGLVVPIHSWCVLCVPVLSATVLALTYLIGDPLRVMKQYTDTCATMYIQNHVQEYLLDETDFKTVFGMNFSIVHWMVIINLAFYALAAIGRLFYCMENGVKEFYRRKYYCEDSFFLFSVPDKAKTYDYATWIAEVQNKLEGVKEPLAEGETESTEAAQLRAELDGIVLAPHHLLLQLRDKVRRANMRRTQAVMAHQARRVGGGMGGFGDLQQRSTSIAPTQLDVDDFGASGLDHSLVGDYTFGEHLNGSAGRTRPRSRMAGALDVMRSDFAVSGSGPRTRVFPPHVSSAPTAGNNASGEGNGDADGGDTAEDLLLPEAHSYADGNRRRFDQFESINPNGYFGGARLPTSPSYQELSADSHSSDDEPTRRRRLQLRQARRDARRHARGSNAHRREPHAASQNGRGFSPTSTGDAAATTRHQMANPLHGDGAAPDNFALDIAPTPNARERRVVAAPDDEDHQPHRRHHRERSGLSSLNGGQPRRPFHLPPPVEDAAQSQVASGLLTPVPDSGIVKNPYLFSNGLAGAPSLGDQDLEDEEYEEFEEYEEVEEEIEEEEEEEEGQAAQLGPVQTHVPPSSRFQSSTAAGLPPAGPSANSRAAQQQQQQPPAHGSGHSRQHSAQSPSPHDSLFSSFSGQPAGMGQPAQSQQLYRDPLSSSFAGGSPMARSPPARPQQQPQQQQARRAPGGHGVRRGGAPPPPVPTPRAREDGGEADRRQSPAPSRQHSEPQQGLSRHQSANRRSGSGTLPPPPPPPSA